MPVPQTGGLELDCEATLHLGDLQIVMAVRAALTETLQCRLVLDRQTHLRTWDASGFFTREYRSTGPGCVEDASI